jgi:hypothetical protein
MTTGLPKQPTISSIVLGIGLFIVALLAFLRLPDVVKYTGTALMYVPAKIGLFDMVMPRDVIPMSLAENPSSVTFSSPGRYIMYINNYDLLVIHDTVVEGNSQPWLNIESASHDTKVAITLIGRGLTWYDTPFAPGRPVISFEIDQPGVYQFTHPTRPDIAHIVPDTLTGQESRITFWVLAEIVLISGVVIYIVRKRTASRRQLRSNILAQNRARVEEARKRVEKRTEEKRREEDQPYWKKK